MEFSICRGGRGESGGVIFNVFSATHQNASKAFLSHFRHFYFFVTPPPHQARIEIFKYFWSFKRQPTYGKFHMFFADNF